MNGLGGLNKSPNGAVIGLVQLQLPKIETRADIAAGRYRVPWEDEVIVTDGTACGFPTPTRSYGGAASLRDAAE